MCPLVCAGVDYDAAVQSMGNMGYTVVGAEALITRGLQALEEND